jgi:hypothetical protein
MKKLVLFFAAVAMSHSIGFAQNCLPEGITFTTQTQVDSFAINYPGCTEILGSVIFEGDPTNDITNLNGLSTLTSIGGNLSIGSAMWPGGCIGLNLNSLSGLNNITKIGGDLRLCGCSLSDLAGLESLTSVEGNFIIHDNYLASLSGLEQLDSIGYNLKIGEVSEYGDPYGNNGLQNLSELGGLNYVGLSISIAGNNSLSSLIGLKNLTSIGGFLEINMNSSLINLAGLENIAAESIDSLTIVNNILLTTCEVQSICDYFATPNGTTEIHDNAPGCNSQEEVEAACDEVSIESISLENEFLLFPNPADKIVTISGNAGLAIYEVVIYNQTGQKVLQRNPVNNPLDISKLRPGMYIVELAIYQGSIRKKLIVE